MTLVTPPDIQELSPSRQTPSGDPRQSERQPDSEWNDVLARIASTAAQREHEDRFPYEEVRELAERGFGALLVPIELGGTGLSYRATFDLIIRLGAADANIAHIFRNHTAFVNELVNHPDRTKTAHWLKRAAAGDLFANGVTDGIRNRDASGRADSSRYSTRLSTKPDGHFLDGEKKYATGSLYADWLAIRTTLDDDRNAIAIVSTKQSGVQVLDDWQGFGQRFTASGTVILDRVPVDATHAILYFDKTRPGSEYGATIAQLFLTAIIAGIVQASFDAAQHLLQTRTQNLYFAPTVDPKEDPLLLHTLGQLSANAFAARAVVLLAAEDLDRTAALPLADRFEAAHEHALSAAKAKVVIDALGTASASLLFDIAGASATHRDKQLDRHWRNARTLSTHNPSLYKALAIGAYLARGERLPKLGFF